MITTNDIGKQFLDTGFQKPVTLVALDTFNGVPMACVSNPNMPNPSGIPGLCNYWVHLASLTPVEGN